jgi:hypothetical protein
MRGPTNQFITSEKKEIKIYKFIGRIIIKKLYRCNSNMNGGLVHYKSVEEDSSILHHNHKATK